MALPGEFGYSGSVYNADPHRPVAEEPEAPPTRSLPRAAIDLGITAAQVIPDTLRSVTGAWRSAADDPHGLSAKADRIMAGIQHGTEDLLSDRAKQIREEKYFPGVDEPSARGDLLAKGAQEVAGFVPWMAVGLLTGGLGFAGRLVEAGGFGAQQLGMYNNQLRDYYDRTDFTKDPKMAPVWQKAMQDAGGDEDVARNNLYKKAFDNLTAAANFATGAVGGVGLAGKLAPGITSRVGRGAVGTLEGAGIGATMGGLGEYGQQKGEMNVGGRTAIDVGRIESAAKESAVPMAIGVGIPHLITSGGRRPDGKEEPPPPDDTKTTTPPTSVDPELVPALKEATGGAPPPPAPPPGTIPPPYRGPGLPGAPTPGERPLPPPWRDMGPSPPRPPEPRPEPPEGPPGRPDTRRPGGEPFRPGVEPPEGPPGVAPRPRAPTPYGGEVDTPEGPPGRPAARAIAPGTRAFTGELDVGRGPFETAPRQGPGDLLLEYGRTLEGVTIPAETTEQAQLLGVPRPGERAARTPPGVPDPFSAYSASLGITPEVTVKRTPQRRRDEEPPDDEGGGGGEPPPTAPTEGGGGAPASWAEMLGAAAPAAEEKPKAPKAEALKKKAKGKKEEVTKPVTEAEAAAEKATEKVVEPVKETAEAQAAKEAAKEAAPKEPVTIWKSPEEGGARQFYQTPDGQVILRRSNDYDVKGEPHLTGQKINKNGKFAAGFKQYKVEGLVEVADPTAKPKTEKVKEVAKEGSAKKEEGTTPTAEPEAKAEVAAEVKTEEPPVKSELEGKSLSVADLRGTTDRTGKRAEQEGRTVTARVSPTGLGKFKKGKLTTTLWKADEPHPLVGAEREVTVQPRKGLQRLKAIKEKVESAYTTARKRGGALLGRKKIQGVSSEERYVDPKTGKVEERTVRGWRDVRGDIANAEVYNAWTGQKLSDTDHITHLQATFGIDRKLEEVPMPAHFQSDAARRARWEAGLPLDWERFRKVMADAIRATEEGVSKLKTTLEQREQKELTGEPVQLTRKGTAFTAQGLANQKRWAEQRVQREAAIKEELTKVWNQESKKKRDALLVEATHDVGGARERAGRGAPPKMPEMSWAERLGLKKRKMTKEERAAEKAAEKGSVASTMETARRVLGLLDKQLEAWENRRHNEEVASRQRGEVNPNSVHPVWNTPKKLRGRAGKVDDPWYSRLGRLVVLQDRLSKLLKKYDETQKGVMDPKLRFKGGDFSEVRRRLTNWASDEKVGAELSRQQRKMLSDLTGEGFKGDSLDAEITTPEGQVQLREKHEAEAEKHIEPTATADELKERWADETRRDLAREHNIHSRRDAERRGFSKTLLDVLYPDEEATALRERLAGDLTRIGRNPKLIDVLTDEQVAAFDKVFNKAKEEMPKEQREAMEIRRGPDPVLQAKLDKTHDDQLKAAEALLKQQSKARVGISRARKLIDSNAIPFNHAADLLKIDANASLWRAAVREHMNKRFAQILRDLAEDMPRRRDELRRWADEAERMEGRPTQAMEEITKIMGGSDAARYASEDAHQKLVDWFVERGEADDVLRRIEQVAPSGVAPGKPEGPAVEADKLGTQIPHVETFTKEPEVTKQVTEEPIVKREPIPKVAEDIADWLAGNRPGEAPEMPRDFVDDKAVRNISRLITDQHEPVDMHFRKMMDETVGHVPVVVLHDDIFDRLIAKLDPSITPKDANGYYDWRHDTAYVRKSANFRTEARHEITHAITMGALEHYPQHRARLENIRQFILKNAHRWDQTVDRDVRIALQTKLLNNVHEFVSQLMANDDFKRAISTLNITAADKVKWKTPQARTVLESLVQNIKNMVQRWFGTKSDNSVLNEALISTFELFGAVAKRGRPEYKAGEKVTGAPSLIGDAVKNVLGENGKDLAYWWNKSLREKANNPHHRLLFTRTDQIPARMPSDSRHLGEAIVDTMAQIGGAVKRIPKERNDDEMLQSIMKMTNEKGKELSEKQKDRAAAALMEESAYEFYADEPLGTGRNAHVKADDPYYDDARANYDRVSKEINWLKANYPGFTKMRQEIHDWNKKSGEQNLQAQIRDYTSMEDIVKAGGPTAHDALVKEILKNEIPATFTPAEQAWIDSQRATKADEKKFNALIADYRGAIPEFGHHLHQGPHVPFKRMGENAAVGEYKLLPVDKSKGRFIPLDEEKGVVRPSKDTIEFYTPEAYSEYMKAHANGPRTKLQTVRKIVYEKGTDTRAMRTNKNGLEVPVRPEDAARDTTGKYDIRLQARFNIKHFETDIKERVVAEKIAELKKNPHLTMRDQPELIRDFRLDGPTPHWVSSNMEKVINRVRASAEYQALPAQSQREILGRLYTEAAKATAQAGGRRPGMPREAVKGMSLDLMSAMLETSRQSAYALAHARYGTQLRNQIKALQDHVDARAYSSDNRARQGFADALMARAFRPPDPIAEGFYDINTNRLLKLTYSAKLAGTSFLGINQMEPFIIGVPNLSKDYGYWESMAAVRRAMSDVGFRKVLGAGFKDMLKSGVGLKFKDFANYEKLVIDTLKKNNVKDAGELETLVKHLGDRDFFDPTSINQVDYMDQRGKTFVDRGLDWADHTFRGMNNAVEINNRMGLAIAAYRMARKRGKGIDEATAKAKEILYTSAGQYAKWNEPDIFKNKLLRPMGQFKKYPQRVMSNWIAAVIGAAQGDPGRMKQLMMMLGTQAAVAGLYGLPTEVFSTPVNAAWMAGISPYSWEDILDMGYRFGANEMGPELMEAIAHGGLRFTGVALDERLSQSGLVLFGQPGSNKPKDIQSSIGSIALGAGGSEVFKVLGGAQKTMQALSDYSVGAYDRAESKLLEAATDFAIIRQVADIFDAVRKGDASTAPRAPGGALMGPEYTQWEQIVRGLGFKPAGEARSQEQSRAERRMQGHLTEERKTWVDRYVAASPAARPGIKRQIDEWNDQHPYQQRIHGSDLVQAQARRRKQEARPASEFALPLNKRSQPTHEEYSRLYMTGG